MPYDANNIINLYIHDNMAKTLLNQKWKQL